MKELNKILSFILIAIIIFTIFTEWNTYDIKKLQRENENLNNRIQQLEVDYKIYDYDIKSMKEKK